MRDKFEYARTLLRNESPEKFMQHRIFGHNLWDYNPEKMKYIKYSGWSMELIKESYDWVLTSLKRRVK